MDRNQKGGTLVFPNLGDNMTLIKGYKTAQSPTVAHFLWVSAGFSGPWRKFRRDVVKPVILMGWDVTAPVYCDVIYQRVFPKPDSMSVYIHCESSLGLCVSVKNTQLPQVSPTVSQKSHPCLQTVPGCVCLSDSSATAICHTLTLSGQDLMHILHALD